MIIWAFAPNPGVTSVNFVIAGLDPNTGFVRGNDDGRMHNLASFDNPDRYLIKSEGRFPAPVVGTFWAFVSEAFMQDGSYLVQWTAVGVSGFAGEYEIKVEKGVKVDELQPPGLVRPPVCVLTGAEYYPDGTPQQNTIIRVELASENSMSRTALGEVAGVIRAKSGVDGSWKIPMIPSSRMIPVTLYNLKKMHFSYGTREYENLEIPDAQTATFESVLVTSFIRQHEVTPPAAFPPTTPLAGYTRVSGKVVDVSGRPIGSAQVIVGTGGADHRTFNKPNDIRTAAQPAVQLSSIESRLETITTPDLILSISVYPNAETLSVQLPLWAQPVEILNGYGVSLGARDFVYTPATGLLQFNNPFFGVVKYRQLSDGGFSFDLPSGNSFWIQIGLNSFRHPFYVPPGAPDFDVGAVVFPFFDR